ncbi:hypothetical protein [Parablautia muri]|uniref:Uncharacterized protein n=1 Tax=Parablautia muri TaxID=2320879 RepID=A0A9X5BGX8_9FIRM|nr:hypothetical protein [Parablautia muri]NBJ93603.1 hypothetical protein [Parablautia muri]
MGIRIGSNNSNVRIIKLRNADGSSAGTVRISSPEKKKLKRLNYNFKEISSQILATKTSSGANRIKIKARQKAAMLQGKLTNSSSDYDSRELRMALAHAQKMERIARKRMKHLKEEEQAKQNGINSIDEIIDEEEIFELENLEDDDALELTKEEMEELMEEFNRLMEESMEELQDEMGLGELAEELASFSYEEISPEDLERMKKKHRSEELKEIVEADMKYLKAMIDKMLQDKQENANHVSLQLSGVDIPVDIPEVPVPVEGGNVDISL